MKINKAEIKKLFEIVPKQLRNRTLLVGGYPRDILSGKKPNDKDFVIENSSHAEMISLGFSQVGKDFPVYLLNGEEFSLCRIDRKTGEGYLNFQFITKGISFKDDFLRRDLTVNAIGINIKGEIFDPFNGIKDIENKVLKHVSEAFSEDPVRVLRLARMKVKFPDFTIHEDTKKLVLNLRSELSTLNPERMFKELEKVLIFDNASMYFRTLLDLGVLDLTFPELYIMKDFNHSPDYHAEGSVLEHSLRVLDQACLLSKKSKVRFAALFHDIGKPFTAEDNNSYPRHSETDLVIDKFNLMKERLRLPKDYVTLGILGARLHHKFHSIKEVSTKGLVRIFFEKGFPKSKESFLDLLNVIQADSKGRIISTNGRTLTFNESNKVFENGKIKLDNVEYIQGDSDLDISLMINLFNVSLMKSEAGTWILNQTNNNINKKKPSVDSIKQFKHKEKLSRFKEVLEKYNAG